MSVVTKFDMLRIQSLFTTMDDTHRIVNSKTGYLGGEHTSPHNFNIHFFHVRLSMTAKLLSVCVCWCCNQANYDLKRQEEEEALRSTINSNFGNETEKSFKQCNVLNSIEIGLLHFTSLIFSAKILLCLKGKRNFTIYDL